MKTQTTTPEWVSTISDKRSDIRMSIFLILQPCIWTDSAYSVAGVCVLTLMSILVCFCHIASARKEYADLTTADVIARHCKYSVFFCLMMCAIAVLSILR